MSTDALQGVAITVAPDIRCSSASADGFLFTRSREYPNAVADFERSFRTLGTVACGILLTPAMWMVRANGSASG